jgi:hypothetical protein
MPNELSPRRQISSANPIELPAKVDNATDYPLRQAAEAGIFLPPWESIASHIAEDGNGGDTVLVPRRLLRFMIRCLLDHTEFDEMQYRKCNPDVAEAVRNKDFVSGRDHFLSVGYFEGRMGAAPVLRRGISHGTQMWLPPSRPAKSSPGNSSIARPVRENGAHPILLQ